MDSDMLNKPATRTVFADVTRKFSDFRSDEGGAIAIFVIFIFVMMVMFGGIAVDVMRFEMRRVALQETMDRATLSASNVVLPPDQLPQVARVLSKRSLRQLRLMSPLATLSR